MTDIDQSKICRVCGLYFPSFHPWGENGLIPSRDICDCCGIEFGYEDNNLKSIEKARHKWLDSGMIWFDPKKQPSSWNPLSQLKNIPKEFLGPDEKY